MDGARDRLTSSEATDPRTAQLPDSLDRVAARVGELGASAEHALRSVRAERSGQSQGAPGAADDFLHTLEARLVEFEREASALADLVTRAREALEGTGSPRREREPDPEPGASATKVSPGMRIVANQMAAEGSSREEIEARLREEFGVSAARAVVDEAFSSH